MTKQNLKYRLTNTKTGEAISYHRSPSAAGRAARRFAAQYRRANGPGYVPVSLDERFVDTGEVSGYGYSMCADESAVDAYDQARSNYR